MSDISSKLVALAVLTFLHERDLSVDSSVFGKLCDATAGFLKSRVADGLSEGARHSGRTVVIATDFAMFPLPHDDSLVTEHSVPCRESLLPRGAEYRRVTAPADHTFKNTRTRAMRVDDPFQTRKRKVIQISQVESNISSLVDVPFYNYDSE